MQVIVVIESAFYLNVFKTLHVFVLYDCVAMCLLGMMVPWLAINLALNYIEYYFLLAGLICHSIYFSYLNYGYEIEHFNYLMKNNNKKEEEKGLVSQLLPTHAFLKLKSEKIDNKLELTD